MHFIDNIENCFHRFFWKIVQNGDGRAVAFIGFNYPGIDNDAVANDIQTSQITRACSAPITDVFDAGTKKNYYISQQIFSSKSGKIYGNIIACNLNDVQLPEMILARDNYMKKPGSTWVLLTV